MKISKIIEELEAYKKEHGDLDVLIFDEHYGDCGDFSIRFDNEHTDEFVEKNNTSNFIASRVVE